jgi:hypothetical protein
MSRDRRHERRREQIEQRLKRIRQSDRGFRATIEGCPQGGNARPGGENVNAERLPQNSAARTYSQDNFGGDVGST